LTRQHGDDDGEQCARRRETYAAGKVSIENWRWQGVPIFFRTGKAMARQVAEVIVRLNDNVLGEILAGGQVEFPGPDEIARAWEIVDPLLRHWESRGQPEIYARGSWGPRAADDLISAHGGGQWLDATDLVQAEAPL
jgi:glucose-6-phosphate 1-dehydrogenase